MLPGTWRRSVGHQQPIATPAVASRGVTVCGVPSGTVVLEAQYDYNYRGSDGRQVCIREGERFILLKKTNTDWWQVRRIGAASKTKPLYVPATYVTEVPIAPIASPQRLVMSASLNSNLRMFPRVSLSPGPTAAIYNEQHHVNKPLYRSMENLNSNNAFHGLYNHTSTGGGHYPTLPLSGFTFTPNSSSSPSGHLMVPGSPAAATTRTEPRNPRVVPMITRSQSSSNLPENVTDNPYDEVGGGFSNRVYQRMPRKSCSQWDMVGASGKNNHLQVTLKFDFQVEVCRVDVELWPWGMDRGQACKRLEVSTSCDRVLPHNFDHSHKLNQQKEHTQMQSKFQNKQKREKEEHGNKSSQCNQKSRRIKNGDEWSIQACQWGDETQTQSQQMGHMLKCQSQTVDGYPEPQFRLVGRCELKEETQVCFTQSNFRPRPPFLSSLPPQPPNCLQEVLWKQGLLGAVTQLRVTMPFGGAASALGFKALAVWGQPARCCAAEEVERIKRVHEVSSKRLPSPAFYTTSLNQTKPQLQAGTPLSNLSIPEEFLDPITQEIMTLPMLLPSGVSVDNTTLEKHQKREATWGRPPNDPFTGVPFTSTSNPLPNPQLKSRIDHFLLQNKVMRTDRVLGRQGKTEDPQSSRLIASKADGKTQSNLCLIKSSNKSVIQCNAGISSTNWTTQRDGSALTQSESQNHPSNSQHFAANLESRLKKENINQGSESSEWLSAEQEQRFQAKRPRNDAVSFPSCSSHEQRLSASLDEALFSALQGRPSFTSNLSHQRRLTPDPELPNTSKNSQIAALSMPTGEKRCSSCFCSLSIYSQSTTSVYRLTCGHLLCRCCLQKESQPLSAVTISTSNHISCPACQCPTPCSDIIRVHH